VETRVPPFGGTRVRRNYVSSPSDCSPGGVLIAQASRWKGGNLFAPWSTGGRRKAKGNGEERKETLPRLSTSSLSCCTNTHRV